MKKFIVFHHNAFEDFIFWEQTDSVIFNKIKDLIKDISRDPFKGLGKPEPLKNEYKGYWSRRINLEHRLIYKVNNDDIIIASCRFHY